MTPGCISENVDSWIAEDTIPASAALKVLRTSDPDFSLTEDEIQDRNEFIRCYLLSSFGPIMRIATQEPEDDFFVPDCDVTDPAYSAFNTHDFQRSQRPFDKYAYAMKMILEEVKDLAILHSSVSNSEGRLRTYQRYQDLVEREFRDRLLELVQRYPRCRTESGRFSAKQQIGELNRRIMDCKRVWELYAPPEVWDA